MDSRWFVYLSKGSSELMLTISSEPWKPVWEWLELIDGLSEFRPPPSESTHLLLSKGHQQFGQFCGRPLVLCMRTHYKGAVASIRKNLPQTWGRKSSSGLSDFHWTEWNFSITRSFFFCLRPQVGGFRRPDRRETPVLCRHGRDRQLSAHRTSPFRSFGQLYLSAGPLPALFSPHPYSQR